MRIEAKRYPDIKCLVLKVEDEYPMYINKGFEQSVVTIHNTTIDDIAALRDDLNTIVEDAIEEEINQMGSVPSEVY
jgi:hypothetical protein